MFFSLLYFLLKQSFFEGIVMHFLIRIWLFLFSTICYVDFSIKDIILRRSQDMEEENQESLGITQRYFRGFKILYVSRIFNRFSFKRFFLKNKILFVDSLKPDTIFLMRYYIYFPVLDNLSN